MKLSEKGIEKVQNYSSVDLEIEGFEPDDFEDCVVLTIEEAKAVQEIMEEVFFWLKDNFAFKNEVLTKRGMEDWKLFCDKIEQAEAQNDC